MYINLSFDILTCFYEMYVYVHFVFAVNDLIA